MTTTNRIAYGLTVVAILAGSWLALAWWGSVIEGPVQAFVGWSRSLGIPGQVALLFAMPAACYLGMYALNRRDEARRFAHDRTIHVEPSRWTPAFRRRFAWLCLPVVLVVAKIAVDTLLL